MSGRRSTHNVYEYNLHGVDLLTSAALGASTRAEGRKADLNNRINTDKTLS